MYKEWMGGAGKWRYSMTMNYQEVFINYRKGLINTYAVINENYIYEMLYYFQHLVIDSQYRRAKKDLGIKRTQPFISIQDEDKGPGKLSNHNNRYHSVECFPCVKHFITILSNSYMTLTLLSNHYFSPARKAVLFHFTAKKTETQNLSNLYRVTQVANAASGT